MYRYILCEVSSQFDLLPLVYLTFEIAEGATARCDGAMRAALQRDGFTVLPGAIAPELVRAALREINRELGSASGGSDAFKAKTFAHHPAIVDLVKRSSAPYLLAELLGGTPEYYRTQITTGQLALRFPGDLCAPGSAAVSPGAFENVRKHWHIDGCPSAFIPGVTDHYGEVHNFTALVGCLLSDVPEPMSGELCVYPGSAEALAAHFAHKGKLDELQRLGDKAFPHAETNTLFTRPVKHCVGRAGTLFIANYMTAHFIAPNTAAHIRYAVYFRVKSPSFHAGRRDDGTRPEAMLKPWLDWSGLEGGAATGDAAVPGALRRQPTREEAGAQRARDLHLATANYDHTQRT